MLSPKGFRTYHYLALRTNTGRTFYPTRYWMHDPIVISLQHRGYDESRFEHTFWLAVFFCLITRKVKIWLQSRSQNRSSSLVFEVVVRWAVRTTGDSRRLMATVVQLQQSLNAFLYKLTQSMRRIRHQPRPHQLVSQQSMKVAIKT